MPGLNYCINNGFEDLGFFYFIRHQNTSHSCSFVDILINLVWNASLRGEIHNGIRYENKWKRDLTFQSKCNHTKDKWLSGLVFKIEVEKNVIVISDHHQMKKLH